MTRQVLEVKKHAEPHLARPQSKGCTISNIVVDERDNVRILKADAVILSAGNHQNSLLLQGAVRRLKFYWSEKQCLVDKNVVAGALQRDPKLKKGTFELLGVFPKECRGTCLTSDVS